MFEDGYNLMQAYLFYKKCNRKGITATPEKLNRKQADQILELALQYDYSKDFDLEKAKNLYKNGYSLKKAIKDGIKERSKNL